MDGTTRMSGVLIEWMTERSTGPNWGSPVAGMPSARVRLGGQLDGVQPLKPQSCRSDISEWRSDGAIR